MIRRRAFVSGNVQGVGYRWAAREEAQRLGVTGWVKNLTDGRVEMEVEGDDEKVEAFLRWAEIGPFGARVSRVVAEALELHDSTEFVIAR